MNAVRGGPLLPKPGVGMTDNFKPGDVAMVQCSDGQYRRAAYFEPTFDQPTWVFSDNSRRRVSESTTRPLVVIDPEDRKQVERLYALMWRDERGEVPPTADDPIYAEDVQDLTAALREFATPTPPKPDEPQGLGAVVEDAEGERWVRSHPDINPWTRPHLSGAYPFAKIAAVRVLSEGVTA
jgi:hypothetical protein